MRQFAHAPLVRFHDWDCNVTVTRYANTERIALLLTDASTGEEIATATVNMPNFHVPSNHVCIKNYSENEGMLEALMEAGIISEPVDHKQSGFVLIPVCQLLL